MASSDALQSQISEIGFINKQASSSQTRRQELWTRGKYKLPETLTRLDMWIRIMQCWAQPLNGNVCSDQTVRSDSDWIVWEFNRKVLQETLVEGFECVKDCIKTVTTPAGWITLAAKTIASLVKMIRSKHWSHPSIRGFSSPRNSQIRNQIKKQTPARYLYIRTLSRHEGRQLCWAFCQLGKI